MGWERAEAAWTASYISIDTHLWKMNEWSIHARLILSPIIHFCLETVQCSTLVSRGTVKLFDVRAWCNRKKHKVSPGLSVQVSGKFSWLSNVMWPSNGTDQRRTVFWSLSTVRIIMKSQVLLISLHHPSKYFNTLSRRFQLCNKELLHYMHISL